MQNITFADRILSFYKRLEIKQPLPPGVVVLNPFKEASAKNLYEAFYKKFYNDTNQRYLILGINPGRFGGGSTGVPFTDPVKLETYCDIPNTLQKKVELSADFIYSMIHAYGGVERFYNKFYISAISPLGFTKDNKNLNYYDIKELQTALQDFIVDSLKEQLNFGIHRDVCFCLGEGTNYQYLNKLNQQYQFFNSIVPLPHPRFIMQYRRKRLQEFIDLYVTNLQSVKD